MTHVQDPAATSHQEQLDTLMAEVQALREQLRRSQRLAAVGTMTAMVAHEFNNILTPIINYAQLAKTNPRLVDKAIARAADGSQRASTICKSLLRMTHDSVESTDENLAELLQDTLSAMARDLTKDGIELVLNVPADLQVSTRRVELQQVLLNLIINARSAMLDQRTRTNRIEIAAAREGSQVVIRLSDSGPGIPPEHLDQIFEPFFSTKPLEQADDKGGHGLGLAVCREIITSLGGSISAQSQPGQGATFTISLPQPS